MRVAIITSGYFPVPATLGGAVEALDEYLINQNEIQAKMELVVFSSYSAQAESIAKSYRNTKIVFIKSFKLIEVGDKCLYWFAKNVLKKEKHMSYRYILQRLYFIECVSQKLKMENYDKVVLENHASLFRILKKHNNYRKYLGKYYYHLHNVVTSNYGCDIIIKNCKKILGVSDYINSTLAAFLKEPVDNKYTVYRNRVDETRFRAEYTLEELTQFKKQYGLPFNAKIILFAGRINPEKGIKELLIAFSKVENKEAKLVIVGSYYFGSNMHSAFEQELENLVKEISDKIIFTGYMRYSDMPKLYTVADLVVIPSMWDDPAPLTVIETLTAGRPLITTYSGGIPEYADEHCAILLNRDDKVIDNLKVSIERLLTNDALRENLSKSAKKTTENWTLDNFYNDFVHLLEA
jgi:spore coat protein SA